jgi:hypothetical protein
MVYSGFDDLDDLVAPEETAPILAPPLVYHLRKLFRQNLDRLIATDGALPLDPTEDLNAALERLYPAEENLKAIVAKLERLTLFHQTLSNQGSQHVQQLRETEEQVFTLFGLKLGVANHIGTILVIDDNVSDVDLLSTAFAKQTYRVITAHSEPRAIEMAREHKPDLILIDMLTSKPTPTPRTSPSSSPVPSTVPSSR